MEGIFSEHEGGAAPFRDSKDRIAAQIAALASSRGIRVLRAGGPVFVRHGLISPLNTPYVPYVVDPVRVADLSDVLSGAGWSRVRSGAGNLPASVTSFVHDRFDARVHLYAIFPGFFAEPALVFQRMWDDRLVMTVAEQDFTILDKLGTVMLAAHDRTDGTRWTRRVENHFDYFITQFRLALSASERESLLRLARAFGAEHELRPLLEGLGLAVGPPEQPSDEYVRARLGIRDIMPGDHWLITRWERPPDARLPFPGILTAARSLSRRLR